MLMLLTQEAYFKPLFCDSVKKKKREEDCLGFIPEKIKLKSQSVAHF